MRYSLMAAHPEESRDTDGADNEKKILRT